MIDIVKFIFTGLAALMLLTLMNILIIGIMWVLRIVLMWFFDVDYVLMWKSYFEKIKKEYTEDD